MVLATYGPHEIDVPAGLLVARVRLVYGDVLNLAPDAEALVGSEIAPESYVLKVGDDLHFIRASGRKGVGEHVWTEEQFCQFFQICSQDLQAWIAQGLKVKRCLDGSLRITETAVDEFFRGKEEAALDHNGYSLASDLLTEEEAIRYLRLDTIQIANPQETLRRYREQALLRGTQVSKRVFYRRCELDQFLSRITETNPR